MFPDLGFRKTTNVQAELLIRSPDDLVLAGLVGESIADSEFHREDTPLC
jgi:hypothetical protein